MTVHEYTRYEDDSGPSGYNDLAISKWRFIMEWNINAETDNFI